MILNAVYDLENRKNKFRIFLLFSVQGSVEPNQFWSPWFCLLSNYFRFCSNPAKFAQIYKIFVVE